MNQSQGAVLVVDDNPVNRILLTAQIEREGYTVLTAEGGRQGLATLRDQPIDVVLLDLMMPEMDGFEVLERLKADNDLRHIPVIVISALDEMESVARCIAMGAADHLARPVDPNLLRARLTSSLAAKHLHDQETEYLRQISYLTNAAADVEAGHFDPGTLSALAERNDALGQLARVFQGMAREVYARERTLQQQNMFKSALIGKITHELRSPFVAADFSVQLLERYAERNMVDELREQIRQLSRQLAEGRRMINGIISYASLVGRTSHPTLVTTDFEALIRQMAAPLQVVADTRQIVLSFDIQSPLPEVKVDPGQMGEAIYHLVQNAIKFNREGGSVKVVCRSSGGQLIFRVEDTGRGVSPDQLASIWEAFVQSASDVQRGMEGVGIGLALVKNVVEGHHGEVAASSRPGEGSVFGFRIPIG